MKMPEPKTITKSAIIYFRRRQRLYPLSFGKIRKTDGEVGFASFSEIELTKTIYKIKLRKL
jgi:hypothetical protein